MSYANSDIQREYQRKWKLARRNAWLKEHGPCAICGNWEDLNVSLIDLSTKLNYAVWGWKQERRDAELAKCQVLCRQCHSEKCWGKVRATRQHGTERMYRVGCSCDECKKAHAMYRRKQKSTSLNLPYIAKPQI